MAVGSKDLSIDKLAELSNEELAAKLSEAKKELSTSASRKSPVRLTAGRRRTIKRDIARIYTVLRERELGIRPATEGESKWSEVKNEERGYRKTRRGYVVPTRWTRPLSSRSRIT